jgi:hypothetical protein
MIRWASPDCAKVATSVAVAGPMSRYDSRHVGSGATPLHRSNQETAPGLAQNPSQGAARHGTDSGTTVYSRLNW